MKAYRISFLLLLSMFQCNAEVSFKGIYSKIMGHAEQNTFEEHPFGAGGTVTIENSSGNITIKGWTLPKIAIETSITSPEKEQKNITINKKVSKDIAFLQTNDKTKKGSVEYQLIVPHNTNIVIKTKSGSIKIKEVEGTITAHTQKGSIEIYDATQSIEASATNDIKVYYNATPLNAFIALQTISGTIQLYMPKEINANLSAKALNGTVTSEHYITLKSRTMLLNNKSWNRCKKEVEGTIGNGGMSIKLNTQKGSIKLLKY